jgi:serine kinase of HPr protein (carbohydrate metabolism regulator)
LPGAGLEARARVHGTAVALGEDGALIRGPSGAGKSDLALRCLAVAAPALVRQPARLVADDQVEMVCTGEAIRLSAPATIAGLIEVRGLGLLTLGHVSEARLRLVVDLVGPGQYDRMPEKKSVSLLGVSVPCLELAPFEASAAVKLLLALQAVGLGGLEPPI